MANVSRLPRQNAIRAVQDDGEREQAAEAKRDHERAWSEVQLDLHPVPADDIGHELDSKPAHQDAGEHAAHGGQNAVHRALEKEGLDKVAALHPDRPSGAHLGASLRSEHDPDQKDQHHADRDAEETEHEEDTREDTAREIRSCQSLALDLSHREGMQP